MDAEMTDFYPHESPLVMGMVFAILGIFGFFYRFHHPWVSSCPIYPDQMICDDMDYFVIIACVAGVFGLSLMVTALMQES
jgi:hypothetical protein